MPHRPLRSSHGLLFYMLVLGGFFLAYSLPAAWQLVTAGPSGITAHDLTNFYVGAKAYWLHGRSPYQLSVMLELAKLEPELQTEYDYLPFLYNPLAVALFYPLQLVSLTTAKAIVVGINLALALVLARVFWQLLDRYGLPGWQRFTLVLVTIFLPSMWAGINAGQINTFLALAMLGTLWFQDRNGKVPAWLWLVDFFFLTIKIQFAIVLLPFMIRRGNWRGMLTGGGLLAVGVLAYLLLSPAIFSYYADAVAGRIEGGNMALSPQMHSNMGGMYNWALSNVLRHGEYFLTYMGHVVDMHAALTVYTLLGLAVLALLLWPRRRALLNQIWSVRTAVAVLAWWGFCFAPVSWTHYLIFLMPLLLLAVLEGYPARPTEALLWAAPIAVFVIPALFGKELNADFPMVKRMLPGLLWAVKGSVIPVLMAGLWLGLVWVDAQVNRRDDAGTSTPRL